MTNKPTSSDIFDINKKTGALILGKNRLDDYATKYLTRHCKKALETPMPLPVDEILQKANLTVKEVHEALHWEKDKTYFEILAVKNAAASEKLYPIMCRQSETFYEPPEGKKTKENEVKWLEWQAHRLAPRVLMPFEMFKKKALELIDSYQNPQNDIIPSCDTLIEDLSTFFIVSRVSVKYRLIEVGLLDRISGFEDFDAVFAEINSSKELVALTPVEAYQL